MVLTAGLNPWLVRNLIKGRISSAASTEYVMKTFPVKERGLKSLGRSPEEEIIMLINYVAYGTPQAS